MAPKVTDEHKDQRRAEIMAAAMRVFLRKGLQASSMQDIVLESGMSRGGVYLYFSNKEDLIVALFEQGSQQMEESIAQLGLKSRSSWAALEAFLDEGIRRIRRQPDDPEQALIIEFFLSGGRDPRRRDFAAARYEAGIRQLTVIIEQGMARGELRPSVSPGTAARTLVTFLDGLAQEALFIGLAPLDLDAQREAIRSSLTQLLGVAP